ncbi:MAG: hypothetical protein ACRDMV_01425 [Streptosporangiales bacterium]
MILTNSATSHPAVLARARSPAADRTVLRHRGHVVSRITVPTSAGRALPVGPSAADRVVLRGLRHPLRAGETVILHMTFVHAGHATLRVPVTTG